MVCSPPIVSGMQPSLISWLYLLVISSHASFTLYIFRCTSPQSATFIHSNGSTPAQSKYRNSLFQSIQKSDLGVVQYFHRSRYKSYAGRGVNARHMLFKNNKNIDDLTTLTDITVGFWRGIMKNLWTCWGCWTTPINSNSYRIFRNHLLQYLRAVVLLLGLIKKTKQDGTLREW